MKLSAQIGNLERELELEPLEPREAGRWRVLLDGIEHVVDARRIDRGTWSLLIAGRSWIVDVDPGKDGDLVTSVRGTLPTPVKILDARRRLLLQAKAKTAARVASGPLAVRAPMPGKVVEVLVKVGDAVTSGQGLVVVEAMKMENELRAPRDGSVTAVHVVEGQPVEAQEPLVTLG